MIRIKHIYFCCVICFLGMSSIFGNTGKIVRHGVAGYQLSVYIPQSYSKSKAHKVIYINDGQWLFKGSRSLQLERKLDSLIGLKIIDPVLIVGIHSDYDRAETYVPYPIEGRSDFTSTAKQYANTVITQIIPFIDSNYSTIKSREGRALFGFSFGGLNATWQSIFYPDSFSFSAGFSPSYWVHDYQLIKDVKKVSKPTTFWFDIGTKEWNYYVPFIQQAKAQGGTYGSSIFYYEVPNGRHTLSDWKKRIAYPIVLFAGKKQASIATWNIEIEVIKSTSKFGVYYQRMNPIVTLSNGVKYSLASEASYTLQNKQDGELSTDGRFKFLGEKDLKVIVSYKELKKEIILKYKEIEAQKKS